MYVRDVIDLARPTTKKHHAPHTVKLFGRHARGPGGGRWQLNDGGPAFPSTLNHKGTAECVGMTLRDYFGAIAPEPSLEWCCEWAVLHLKATAKAADGL